MKQFITLILISIFIQSCYISRSIEGPCKVRIEMPSPIQLDYIPEAKYIQYSGSEAYTSAFKKALEEELVSMGCIIVYTAEEQADFVLLIKSFTLSETRDITTVQDEKSPYNGQTYALHSCDADAEFVLYKKGQKIKSGWAGVDKDEKLTNNRNVGDYVFGTNKDLTDYRYKGLDETIFIDLSTRCGRRTAARVTKKITKYLK